MTGSTMEPLNYEQPVKSPGLSRGLRLGLVAGAAGIVSAMFAFIALLAAVSGGMAAPLLLIEGPVDFPARATSRVGDGSLMLFVMFAGTAALYAGYALLLMTMTRRRGLLATAIASLHVVCAAAAYALFAPR